MNLELLLQFIKLTQKFKDTERKLIFEKSQRRENDAEHSYQLAITAWYVLYTNQMSLNIEKVLKYALVHDLVEVYAGDTALSETDIVYLQSKQQREKDAQKQIEAEFPEFKELHAIIEEYEKLEDQESKFIYALDKLLPPLNAYLDKGYTWRKNKITLDMLIENKSDKIAISPKIKEYYDSLIELLKKEEDKLFK